MRHSSKDISYGHHEPKISPTACSYFCHAGRQLREGAGSITDVDRNLVSIDRAHTAWTALLLLLLTLWKVHLRACEAPVLGV